MTRLDEDAPRSVLTLGVAASVFPYCDPIGDVLWADGQLGIAGVWFIDHLQGWLPRGVTAGRIGDPHAILDPFVLMGAAAGRTIRVTLGVSVTDPLRRSPAALLQAALSIGWLGSRPMILGLGPGAPQNLRPYGLERPGRARYMEAACDAINDLRSGPEPKTGGREPWERSAAVMGMSAHSTVELWVAAHGPRMLSIAGQYADGWLPAMLSPRAFARGLKQVRAAAETRGRDPDRIVPAMYAWAALAESRKESLRLLREPIARVVSLYRPQAAFARHGAVHPLGTGPHPDYLPATIPAERAMELIREIPDPVVESSLIWGSPDEVEEVLSRYEEAGCRHLILNDVGRFIGTEGEARSRECLARLARGRPSWIRGGFSYVGS